MKKIYILHGWSYDTTKWRPLLAQLKKIDIATVLLKIPGLTEDIDRPWRIDDYVEWLNRKIGKQNKVVLLGHSNGGRIALAYCLKYGFKVKKLFLIDSAGIYHNELPTRMKRHFFKYLAKVGKLITRSAFAKSLLYKLIKENDYNNASPIMKETMQNLISHNLNNSINRLNIKTHIIWGSDDNVTPLSDGIFLNKNIKNSDLKVIIGAKHSPQFTHTTDVVKVIYENI